MHATVLQRASGTIVALAAMGPLSACGQSRYQPVIAEDVFAPAYKVDDRATAQVQTLFTDQPESTSKATYSRTVRNTGGTASSTFDFKCLDARRTSGDPPSCPSGRVVTADPLPVFVSRSRKAELTFFRAHVPIKAPVTVAQNRPPAVQNAPIPAPVRSSTASNSQQRGSPAEVSSPRPTAPQRRPRQRHQPKRQARPTTATFCPPRGKSLSCTKSPAAKRVSAHGRACSRQSLEQGPGSR